jgi:hypothetical protein
MQLLVDNTIEIKLYNFFITTNTPKPLRLMYGILYKIDIQKYCNFYVSFDEAGYSSKHVETANSYGTWNDSIVATLDKYVLVIQDSRRYLGLLPYYLSAGDFMDVATPMWFDTLVTNSTNRHYPNMKGTPPIATTHSVAPVQGDWDL